MAEPQSAFAIGNQSENHISFPRGPHSIVNRQAVRQTPNEPELCAYPEAALTVLDKRPYLRKPIRVFVAPSPVVIDAINRVYEREAGGGELESDDTQVDEHEVAGGDILDSDDEAPVIRWVNSLFLGAMLSPICCWSTMVSLDITPLPSEGSSRVLVVMAQKL